MTLSIKQIRNIATASFILLAIIAISTLIMSIVHYAPTLFEVYVFAIFTGTITGISVAISKKANYLELPLISFMYTVIIIISIVAILLIVDIEHDIPIPFYLPLLIGYGLILLCYNIVKIYLKNHSSQSKIEIIQKIRFLMDYMKLNADEQNKLNLEITNIDIPSLKDFHNTCKFLKARINGIYLYNSFYN